MANDEHDEIGKIFYVLSKLDSENPLPNSRESDSREGWAFFKKISDNDGGFTLDVFQHQFRRVVNRLVREVQLEKLILESLLKMLSNGSCPEDKLRKSIEDAMAKFVDKLQDTALIVSAALFRLFGGTFYFRPFTMCLCFMPDSDYITRIPNQTLTRVA